MENTEYIKQRKIIANVGQTGSGKSYVTKYIVYNLLARVIVFDIMNEYDHKDFIKFYEFESFREYVKEHFKEKDLKIIIKFDNEDDYAKSIELAYLIGNITIVLEEIHNYASATSIDPELNKIIRYGRHKDISIIGTSQRFNDLHLLYRNNIDVLIAHSLTMPNDLKYLAQIGFVGKEGAEQIGNLSKDKHERLLFVNE